MHIARRFYHRINQSREIIVRLQGASPVPLRDALPLECEDIGGKAVFRTKRLAESQSIPLRSSSGFGFVLLARALWEQEGTDSGQFDIPRKAHKFSDRPSEFYPCGPRRRRACWAMGCLTNLYSDVQIAFFLYCCQEKLVRFAETLLSAAAPGAGKWQIAAARKQAEP
jgi:hypothetical protein